MTISKNKNIKIQEVKGCSCFLYGVEKCPTCKSINYHNSIYAGLNNKEQMILFKERTKKAFNKIERGLI